jgi:hypothetical protein
MWFSQLWNQASDDKLDAGLEAVSRVL